MAWTTYTRIVGAWFLEARLSAGLTQDKLSELCSFGRGQLQGIERGRSPISVEQIAELAEIFGTTPGSIIEQADKLKDLLEAKGIGILSRKLREEWSKWTRRARKRKGLSTIRLPGLIEPKSLQFFYKPFITGTFGGKHEQK